MATSTRYDAIIIGTPTRYGNMTAQMKNFLDQTGGLWVRGALNGGGSIERYQVMLKIGFGLNDD